MAEMIFVKDDALMPSDWTYHCTHCHESISHRNLGLRFCPCCGAEIEKWQSEEEGIWWDEFREMWDEEDDEMRDIDYLIEKLESIASICSGMELVGEDGKRTQVADIALYAADALKEYKNCKNELCYKCGEYKQRHLGACDGCRYKE